MHGGTCFTSILPYDWNDDCEGEHTEDDGDGAGKEEGQHTEEDDDEESVDRDGGGESRPGFPERSVPAPFLQTSTALCFTFTILVTTLLTMMILLVTEF